MGFEHLHPLFVCQCLVFSAGIDNTIIGIEKKVGMGRCGLYVSYKAKWLGYWQPSLDYVCVVKKRVLRKAC